MFLHSPARSLAPTLGVHCGITHAAAACCCCDSTTASAKTCGCVCCCYYDSEYWGGCVWHGTLAKFQIVSGVDKAGFDKTLQLCVCVFVCDCVCVRVGPRPTLGAQLLMGPRSWPNEPHSVLKLRVDWKVWGEVLQHMRPAHCFVCFFVMYLHVLFPHISGHQFCCSPGSSTTTVPYSLAWGLRMH